MLTTSNLDSLIAPGALVMAGTVSSRVVRMQTLSGRDLFKSASGAVESALPTGDVGIESIEMCPVELGSSCASYSEISLKTSQGIVVRARFVAPSGAMCTGSSGCPLVLMFNDAGRPVRGWHHMTRFVAAGCAVLALDGKVYAVDEAVQGLADLSNHALLLAKAVPMISGIDLTCVYAWGEGLGGALALFVAACLPASIRRCAVCGPFPLETEMPLLGSSLLDAAPRITAELLIGSGLRDSLALSESCAEIAHRSAGNAELAVYPEHAHERINDFEDRVLGFFVQDVCACS